MVDVLDRTARLTSVPGEPRPIPTGSEEACA